MSTGTTGSPHNILYPLASDPVDFYNDLEDMAVSVSDALEGVLDNVDTGYAKLASPAFTGTPTAPTAADGTDTTQIATTEFVNNEIDYKNARHTVSVTTTSLADLAEWTGTVIMGYSYRILAVTTDAPARVRVYDTAAHRTADASRGIGTDPTTNSGVMLDMVTEPIALTVWTNPAVDGYNAESPISTSIPISVQNLSGGTDTITIDFIYTRSE